MLRSVTSNMHSMRGSLTTASHDASCSGWARNPGLTDSQTPTMARAEISAMARNVARQPNSVPNRLPSGMPTTEAIDQPMKIKAMASERFSGGTIRPTVAAAWGVKTAAAIMVTERMMSRDPKSGARAASPWPTAYSAAIAASSRRRSKRLVRPASTGAPTPTTRPPANSSNPAVAGATCRSAARTFRSPAGSKTPVPMTKLPSNSHHSARRG